ncbi:MAG: FlgD immunoglobulin-like domain containing protein [candidate division WOR-3 bacterium]
MFHFRIDNIKFPDNYEQVVREGLEDINKFSNLSTLQYKEDNGSHEIGLNKTSKFRYAHMLISARYDRAPILEFGEGLSEFYYTGWKAQEKSEEILNTSNSKLKRIYYIWPVTYYEFEECGRTVIIHANLVNQIWDLEDFITKIQREEKQVKSMLEKELKIQGKTLEENRQELIEKSLQEWREALNDDYKQEKRILSVLGYEWAPFYDWSYGCTPIAAAMVLGWIDRYTCYGRLIDYYFQRWDMVEEETDYQVPNTQRELAIAMQTDTTSGGTYESNIQPGIQQVTNTINGYSFTFTTVSGGSTNDWAWATCTTAIKNDHAFVWSYGVTWRGHSTAAFKCSLPGKFIYVHNTWWKSGVWMHYSNNSQYTWIHICVPQRRGMITYAADIISPRGDTLYNHNGSGELWFSGRIDTLRWSNYGMPGDSVQIWFSSNGGRSWTYVGRASDNGKVAINPGNIATTEARFHIRQFKSSYNNPYVSADGSFGNFRIVPSTPAIGLSSTNINVVLQQNGNTTRTLTIYNNGFSNLTWSLTEAPSVAWLSENPTSGYVSPGSSQNVTLSFTAPATTGIYNTSLFITCNDPYNTVETVYVQLSVVTAWQGFEGFNGTIFPPSGWQALPVIGSYNWERKTSNTNPSCVPFEGSGMASYPSFNARRGNMARLISPPIDLGTTARRCTLSFYMYHDTMFSGGNFGPDSVKVEYSIDGTTFYRIAAFRRYEPTTGWRQHIVDLGLHSGTIYIGLLAFSDWGHNINIDAINFRPLNTGIEDLYDDEVLEISELLPLKSTPSINRIVNISFILSKQTRVSLKIYDVTGKLIKTLENSNLNRGTYKYIWRGEDEQDRKVVEGIYFCTLDISDKKFTKKIILKLKR